MAANDYQLLLDKALDASLPASVTAPIAGSESTPVPILTGAGPAATPASAGGIDLAETITRERQKAQEDRAKADKRDTILAFIADTLSGAAGQKGGYTVALRDRQYKEADLAIKQEAALMARIALFQSMRKDQFEMGKSALSLTIDFAKNAPNPTDQERAAAARAGFQMAQQAGAPIDEAVFHGILRNPDFRQTAGDLLPFLNDGASLGYVTGTVGTMLRNQQGEKVGPYLEKLAGPAVAREALGAAQSVVQALKKRPEFAGKSLPLDLVADTVAAIPEKGRAMADYLRGTRFHESTANYDKLVNYLSDLGVQRPGEAADIAKSAATARASAQATKDVDYDPKNIAKEIAAHVAKIQAETPARTAQAVQQARAMIPVEVEKRTALDRAEREGPPKPATLSDMSTFTGQYETQSKSFQEVRDAYGRLRAARPPKDEKLQGPADIALLVAYMKLIDPGSTVRENEFATAANAGGVAENIRNLYNKVVGGSKLTDDLRAAFRTQARSLFESHRETQLAREQEARRQAGARGMKAADVVPDLLGKYRTDDYLKGDDKGKKEDLSKLSDAEIKRRLRERATGGVRG